MHLKYILYSVNLSNTCKHMDILKKNNLKNTNARKNILALFEEGHDILSAEDVFLKLKKKGVDNVTVYRTLDSFEFKGIIKKVDLRKGAAHYELASHHHHHIVCTSCGLVEIFEGCGFDSLSKKALRGSKKFKQINDHSFEFFGVCKNCNKSIAKSW